MSRYGPLLLAVLAACNPAQATRPIDAGRITLLKGPAGKQVLHQCSRAAPFASRTFAVSLADVVAAEPLVLAALKRQRPEVARQQRLTDIAALRAGWVVEATGLVSGGRRLAYLSFLPRRDAGPRRDPTQAMIVCDGGPAFFGATVDLARDAVLDLDFNGAI